MIWPFDPETGHSTAVNRSADPDTWHRMAEGDVAITTQWDDRGPHPSGGPGSVPTSSSSMPSVVASMLRDLDAHPGMAVLEIGTGTGWNAGLLAYRLGDGQVTSIEVDEMVAAQARARLHAAGFHPEVITGDGLRGHLNGAPYDRIIATCGLREVPSTWVEQIRPGGTILAPWGTHYSARDAIARLRVDAEGRSATGRFTAPAQFMKARSQRLAWPSHEHYVTDWPGEASATELAPTEVFSGDPFGVAEFAVGLAVPDCTHTVHDQPDGTTAAWFYGLGDTSWAAVRFTAGAPRSEVFQSGARRLWDEVEAAWRWWDGQGRPRLNRFGLSVDANGHHPWLDHPGNPVPAAPAPRPAPAP